MDIADLGRVTTDGGKAAQRERKPSRVETYQMREAESAVKRAGGVAQIRRHLDAARLAAGATAPSLSSVSTEFLDAAKRGAFGSAAMLADHPSQATARKLAEVHALSSEHCAAANDMAAKANEFREAAFSSSIVASQVADMTKHVRMHELAGIGSSARAFDQRPHLEALGVAGGLTKAANGVREALRQTAGGTEHSYAATIDSELYVDRRHEKQAERDEAKLKALEAIAESAVAAKAEAEEHRAQDKIEAEKLRAQDKAEAEELRAKDKVEADGRHRTTVRVAVLIAVSGWVVALFIANPSYVAELFGFEDQEPVGIVQSMASAPTSPAAPSTTLPSASQGYVLPPIADQIQALCKVPRRC